MGVEISGSTPVVGGSLGFCFCPPQRIQDLSTKHKLQRKLKRNEPTDIHQPMTPGVANSAHTLALKHKLQHKRKLMFGA